MKTAVSESYTDTCEVQRLPDTDLGPRSRSGGSRVRHETVLQVPCRFSPGFLLPRENTIGSSLTNVTQSFVYTAPLVDIRASDRLLVYSAARNRTYSLDVTDVDTPRTLDIEQKATCLEVGGERPSIA